MNIQFRIDKFSFRKANFKSKILKLLLFIVLGLIALQLPVNGLFGADVKFTAFDFVAPVFGAFLGLGFGMFAVLAASLINIFVNDAVLNTASIVRVITPLFAIMYFSSLRANRSKLLLAIPLLAILSFNLNSVGRSVWYYSLFWIIPLLMWKFRERFLFARALGATFTAHAVGGAIWVWAFNLPASVWQGLIPVVALERSIMAFGICASYILMNNVLAYLSSKRLLPAAIGFDKNYVLRTKNSKA